MKWKILNDLVLHQHFCRGAETVLGSALLGSVVSTGASVIQNETNKSWQSGTLQKQMDWQTQEAEKARQFSAQQQEKQQQYNLQLMAEQAKYNSPVYQRQQLQAAGISPAVYFGDKASFSGSSAPSAGIGSAPSASPVSGLSPTVQPLSLKVPELMQSIGSFVRDLSTAKKQGTETSVLEKSMDDVLRKLREDANQSEINTSLLELNKKLQSANVPVQIKQAAANLEQTYAKISLTYSEIDKTDAEEMLNQALSRFNHVLADYKGEELRQLKLLFPLVEKSMRSQIALNYASAEESSSNASFTSYRESMERAMESGNLAKFEDSLVTSFNESLISQEQYNAASAAARIAQTSANHAEELFWKDFIMDIVDEGVGAFLGYKNAKSWQRLSESSKARTAGKIEQVRQEYGDKVVLEDKWHGKKRTRTYHSGKQKYGN